MASKMKFKTMDAYIASFPTEVQGILEQIRHTIRKAVPGATEAISYQIPTFKLNGNLSCLFRRMERAYRILCDAFGECGVQEGTVEIQGGEGVHPVSD